MTARAREIDVIATPSDARRGLERPSHALFRAFYLNDKNANFDNGIQSDGMEWEEFRIERRS